MAEFVVSAEATPNPNAVKFVTNRRLTEGVARSYYDAQAAAGDAVAARLFALPGVTGVMLLNDFCSVNQDGSVDWDVLKPRIEAVLREAFGP